jgi:hypothetical protein
MKREIITLRIRTRVKEKKIAFYPFKERERDTNGNKIGKDQKKEKGIK